ncbi:MULTISPECIES: hypothetical protein [Sphingobacterium]|uniref:Uncharacterized protein n=1 Tax=Sphingobacterium populi TaxID=1812824 RepID=A0ABW5U7Z9_9SPHI|nr:hypothetical protein [Sphingobacterium sp. CFCC 11742]
MKKFGALYLLSAGLVMIMVLMGFVEMITGSRAAAWGVGAFSLFMSFAPKAQGAFFDTMNPDLSALAKYVGKYRKQIYTRFINGLTIFQDVNARYGVKDREQLLKLKINNQPKPFTGVFSPRGNDIVFSDQELTVEKWQRDFQIQPDRYRDTYLSSLRGRGEGANNMTIPFAQFTFEQVNKQLAADINDVTVWWGEGKTAFSAYSSSATYAVDDLIHYVVNGETRFYEVTASTSAGETPLTAPQKFKAADAKAITEGLGTKIRKARANMLIKNVISTGAITRDNAYEQFKAVWRGAPEWLRTQGGILYCSFSNFEKLLDSFENISKYTEKDGTMKYLPLTDKKCELRPVTWKTGSDSLEVVSKDNLIAATDEESDYSDIRVIPQMYHLDYGITGVLGFGVQDYDAMAINDQI